MIQVVSVLIHSYIILILILVPYANKEIQRRDWSCISCNPQYLLKSLLFLRVWLMHACLSQVQKWCAAFVQDLSSDGNLFLNEGWSRPSAALKLPKEKNQSLSQCKCKCKDSQMRENHSIVQIRRINSAKNGCFNVSVAEQNRTFLSLWTKRRAKNPGPLSPFP